MEDTAEGITYKFIEKLYDRECAGLLSCLDAAIPGEAVVAAAAEALYQSGSAFAVDAEMLPTFLHNCPLSPAVKPGTYIKGLVLYMDEDSQFIGDGKDGQALRKADWVDLLSDGGDDRMTRSGHRTQLMRRCWRAILNMPKLERIVFWIMPAQGKVTVSDIQHWEIRDIIPTIFRLTRKRVHVRVYLRTWEVAQESISDIDSPFRVIGEKSYYDVDNNGVYHESGHFDLNLCIPDKWSKPTDSDRSLAWALSARRTLFPWDGTCLSFKCQRVRYYDALRELTDRLTADKSMSDIHSFFNDMVLNLL